MGLPYKFNELMNVKPWGTMSGPQQALCKCQHYYYFVLYLKSDGNPLVLWLPHGYRYQSFFPNWFWMLKLMTPQMNQPRKCEKIIVHIIRLPVGSRTGFRATPKWPEWKERPGALVFIVNIKSGAGLGIPTYMCALIVFTGTKGERAQVLLAAYSDLRQKRGKRRDENQKLSVVRHQKQNQTPVPPPKDF